MRPPEGRSNHVCSLAAGVMPVGGDCRTPAGGWKIADGRELSFGADRLGRSGPEEKTVSAPLGTWTVQRSRPSVERAEELREAVADPVAEAPLGHALADVGRHAVPAVAERDEALDRAGDLHLLAGLGSDARLHASVIGLARFVLRGDVGPDDRLESVAPDQDAAASRIAVLVAADHRHHRAEVRSEVHRQPLVA